MYESSVVALHKVLESPTGDRSIHSSDVSCKISAIPPQITYLDNGIKYYCVEVTCVDGRELPYKSTVMRPRYCSGKHINVFSVPILVMCRS